MMRRCLSPTPSLRAKRSNPECLRGDILDGFVASLLAMTEVAEGTRSTITLLRRLCLSAHLPLARTRELRCEKIAERLDACGARAARWRHQMHGAFNLLPVLQDHFDLARGNGLADDEFRKVGDAEAGDQRRHYRFAVVDAELTARTHAGLLAGRIGVVPDVGRREIGVAETFVLGQMHRMRRPSVLPKIGGCGHRKAR